MAIDLETEQTFFRLFIQKGRAGRFVDRIFNSKRRGKIWGDLRDTRYFANECLVEVIAGDKRVEVMVANLMSYGFLQRAYIMSSDDRIDGSDMALRDVLSSVWNYEEVLGFCSKSKVGFFKNHEDDFYILRKPQT